MLTRVVMVSGCSLAFGVASASAAVTPGWECIPTTAGQSVVSGGTGASPTCGSGTTAVLAPTYVSSGVGGKPTVEFSTVNVQVASGSGSTNGAVNGEGNLIVGYAEAPSGHPQTGSNDLVLGSDNGWSSYGELVGGTGNVASGAYAGVLGQSNTASGAQSSVLGGENGLASTTDAAVSGGNHDTASGTNGAWAAGGFKNVSKGSSTAASGGLSNTVSGSNASVSGGENNTASGAEVAITGGAANTATGGQASITGGRNNTASGTEASITGGALNTASGELASIDGGGSNSATGQASSVSAGEFNIAGDEFSFIGGGCDNLTGSGTANADACDSGGEGMLGGSSVTGTLQDGTFGSTSDGVNSGRNGDFKISLGLGAGACSDVPYGVPGTQVGDVATVAYETNPPPGLLIQTTGVTVAGQVEVEACNVSSATIHYNNVPIRVQTFR